MGLEGKKSIPDAIRALWLAIASVPINEISDLEADILMLITNHPAIQERLENAGR